jgi:hypothetical protein
MVDNDCRRPGGFFYGLVGAKDNLKFLEKCFNQNIVSPEKDILYPNLQ